MTIHLVTNAPELYKLCSDILSDMPELGQSCSFHCVSPEEGWKVSADLHIWDFHPNLPLPEDVARSPARHLFLVNREDLGSLRERIGAAEGKVLLKPATTATLATFLGPSVSNGAAKCLRSDRDEILQCLIQTNLKLQEYDQDRTTFLARAVHDFRTPLSAISGYCGLLLSEPLGALNENQKEVLRRMQNSARRLSRMASAMFELSVGRHVTRRPELRPGDLRECLEQALHEITPFADEKSLSITPDLAGCCDGLWFEAGQIEQALVNLLDNACKFTPKGGAIEIRGYPYFWERRRARLEGLPEIAERRVRANHEPNSYRVDISDAGKPIPEERLTRIFEEYTSYAGAQDRSGGGLGLAICRLILAQHEGRIWAENRVSGPTFSFVLPLRGSEEPPAAGGRLGYGARSTNQ